MRKNRVQGKEFIYFVMKITHEIQKINTQNYEIIDNGYHKKANI